MELKTIMMPDWANLNELNVREKNSEFPMIHE